MAVKTRHAESLRFPARRPSEQGESVPKARPKGVVDGKQVKIPVLICWSDAGTEKVRLSGCWLCRSKHVGR